MTYDGLAFRRVLHHDCRGQERVGWKGFAVFIAIWATLLGVVLALKIDRHFFIAAQAILDAVLISTIYLSFTRLR